MTRVVRIATLFCLAGILVASAAMANVPDPAKSTLSLPHTAVEGSSTTGGVTTMDNCSDGNCGNITITVRDFASNVIAGSTVVVDFSTCPDIQVSCDQQNTLTGQSYLAGHKVSGTTNASGQFILRAVGAANGTPPGANTSAGTNAGVACATVYADGVPLGNLVVAAYDLNGLGTPSAVNASDLSLMSADVLKVAGGGTARAREDFNYSGTVNAGDLGVYLAIVLQASAGTGTRVTSPFCNP
jgi:hypothetical protein